ncbi:S9 family peptidase [Betaproteobacteria bacterium GR16-43]|nr:S9 family peptidase [Betaproteobacteria bacterium GR16-43]
MLIAASSAFAQQPDLIPRSVLFGNPERANPSLSPDGLRMAWLAPDKKNVLQVWVQTIGKEDTKQVTNDKKRGVRIYRWAQDGRTLLYLQDNDGDENYHVFGVDLVGGNVRDFTPVEGTRASIVAAEASVPTEILVTLNARDRKLFDVHRVNLATGAIVLDTQNPGDVGEWRADSKLNVVAAEAKTPDGGTELRVRDNAKSPWRTLLKAGSDDNLDIISVGADGKSLLFASSVGTNTTRVTELSFAASAKGKVIAFSDEVDAGPYLVNAYSKKLQAVAFEPGRRTWKVIDPSVQGDFDAIAKLADGDFQVFNRDRADRNWLVAFTSDRGPVRYFLWERAAKKGTYLFSTQPKLENLKLSEMKPIVVTTRDGHKMHGYLTLPAGLEPKNLPMVMFVHGGPWGRDRWGFNSYAQWFANRGYAVMMMNFRASTGYGKAWLNAGDKQWGLTMQDDLIDATEWAVKQGYVDPKKVAIMGGSYGGYATLAGLTVTPDYFACGVDVVGPSNLRTLLKSIPPYWATIKATFNKRMGNIDDPKDEALIREASPLFKADRIRKPLLIGQGANDPRVNKAESEQIVEAIEKNKGSVTYVVYSDEGHGFARPENNIDFNARTEAFLSQCLGGRAEPMQGDRMPGSTAVVKVVGAAK